MSVFDTVHNTITENAVSVGPTTVIGCTPTELARTVCDALQCDEGSKPCKDCALRVTSVCTGGSACVEVQP